MNRSHFWLIAAAQVLIVFSLSVRVLLAAGFDGGDLVPIFVVAVVLMAGVVLAIIIAGHAIGAVFHTGRIKIPLPPEDGPVGALVEFADGTRGTYDLTAAERDINTDELILYCSNDPNPVRIPMANVHAYSVAPLDKMFIPRDYKDDP